MSDANDDLSETFIIDQIRQANSLSDLEAVRVGLLGRKGVLSSRIRSIGSLPLEQRKDRGAILNDLRLKAENAIKSRRQELQDENVSISSSVDVSLPVRSELQGSRHPVDQVIGEVVAIFAHLGFRVAEGPDIEDEEHNFSALNFPADHPARDEHDSFYVIDDEQEHLRLSGPRRLLRTHTSPMQIRTMRSSEPPLRVIVPGRTFRRDLDATHTPMFHQVEGLVVEDDIHLGHLKGVLTDFCRAFFELPDPPMRFRGSYFPFTEPSLEVDIRARRENHTVIVGEGDEWVEILGCGMVHPHVLENVGMDWRKHQGFAFGLGIERLAMLKYGIPDLRSFFQSDWRWLQHFGCSPRALASIPYGLSATD